MENNLTGANVAMAITTLALVQILKLFMPSPLPEIPGDAPKRFSVKDELQFIPFVASFVIGVALSMVFDPHVGQSLKGKIGDGLQTGAYAVIAWNAYSVTVGSIIARIRGAG